MTGENMVSEGAPVHHKQKKKKAAKPIDLADAWKFGSFALRALVASATGKVFGSAAVDEAMGEAFATIYPPEEAAEKGKHFEILIHGMAGAWKAARGDGKWE